jgi:hypothetical protein
MTMRQEQPGAFSQAFAIAGTEIREEQGARIAVSSSGGAVLS